MSLVSLIKRGVADVWNAGLRAAQLLILIRIPLLLVFLGVLLTRHIDQVSELFDLSLNSHCQLWVAWVFAGILGLLIWYSARTLYAFDWHERVGLSNDWHRVGEYLPRALGALVPLTMAMGYATRRPPNGACGCVWACLYITLAITILLLTWKRRPILQWLAKRSGRKADAWISSLPDVGKYKHWKDLGRPRHWHWMGLVMILITSLIGWRYPHSIDAIGPVALILGGAAWLVWASTAPIYWAARHKIPLLSMLVLWAIGLNLGGYNDNHGVRLTAQMNSIDDPPAKLHYGDEIPPRLSMKQFVADWSEQHSAELCPRVYLVASEGGGIRAAAWTALVLSELEQRSGGQFWRCTLVGSGVSGGSLGLALFSAYLRDHAGKLDAQALLGFFNRDFLAPVLGSSFGVDQLQRLLPGRWFPDRAQALERALIEAYRDSAKTPEPAFDIPLAELLHARSGDQLLPALLLNSTVVGSGTRLIQHPFAPMRMVPSADPALLGPLAPFANQFPGAIDGANWLPAELPLSSAVLSSARFTYVSPAGTVRRSMDEKGGVRTLGQLVDGGYYENSGATTLSDFMRYAADSAPILQSRMVVIHISNDTGVAGLMDRPNGDDSRTSRGEDSCRVAPEQQNDRDEETHLDADTHGELLSPLLTLYQTREARGDQARRVLADQIARTPGMEGSTRFFHFRLCKGPRPIPLGWTIGTHTLAEMTHQLRDEAEVRAKGFPQMACRAVAAGCEAAPTSAGLKPVP